MAYRGKMTLAAEHEAGRRREAARLQGLINKAKAYGARAIVNAVTSDTAVRSAIDKVVADVEKEVYNDPDAVKQGPDLILRSSSAPKARQAIRGAVADGVLEASEKAVGRSSGRWKRLAKVFIRKAIPMIPFGFIDNFLMILAGDMIDATLATTLGISTMAAAGLGNAGSDAVGAMSQDRVEKWMKKIGLGDVETEGGKAEAIAGLAGGAFGVAVGALIGMFPLLFGSDDEENRRGRHMTADSADVIKRIEKTIRNDALADRMIEDVMGYPQTDLDKRDQHLLYRPVEFGEVEQMSKKRKLDIDWTDHAEYRSELRDVDPRRVNDAIVKILRERLRKQKTRGTERVKVPGGTAVVDYDVSKKPGEADVVTVWASVADRIAADEMRLASARKQFNLKATYDKFNRQYFNNELPRITLKWGRSKRWGGLASGRRGPSGDILPVKITISDFLSMDEERFLGIMLHEMIHIWQWVNGHADHHGAFFKAKRQELSGKAPFTIPVSEDITGMQVSDEVATKAMVVIFMEFASGKDGFLIYTAQMYQRLRTKLQAYFERYINMGTMTKVVFVETTDKKFMKFTHSRQVPRRLRYYPVKSGEMQDALSGGKRLETMKRDKEDVAAQRQLKEEVPQKGRRLMDGLARFFLKGLPRIFGVPFRKLDTRIEDGTYSMRFLGGNNIILRVAATYKGGELQFTKIDVWRDRKLVVSQTIKKKYPTTKAVADVIDGAGLERVASVEPVSRRDTLGRELTAGLLETIDTSKKSLPTLWLENQDGDRWVPKLNGGDPPAPEGFHYQVSRFPTQLETNHLKLVQREEVDACSHPPEAVKPTGGWINGVEGRECKKCFGSQTRKVGEPWPDEWDAHGSRQVMTMSQGWSDELALGLVKEGIGLKEAILIAAICCERCMNVLAHEVGLEWGYPEGSEEWEKVGTECEFCDADM